MENKMSMDRETLVEILNDFFGIGDPKSIYTFDLKTDKSEYYGRNVTVDDFEEWDAFSVADLADHIMSWIKWLNENENVSVEECF